MNQGKFYVRRNIETDGAIVPSFELTHGYVQKKGSVRIGIYRETVAGISTYKAVDLRDGQELSAGFTIHETVRDAKPVPTIEIARDSGLLRDVTLLWNWMLENCEDGVTWPSY